MNVRSTGGPAVLAATLMLWACAPPPQLKSQPMAMPVPTPRDMLAAIHAAGRDLDSAVNVLPLRDPGVRQWIEAAKAETAAGHDARAARILNRALTQAPDAPEILQQRAELAVRMQQYAQAEHLARRSWAHGSHVGSLCARNWQTVAEMRRAAGDRAGAAKARRQLAGCRVKDVTRM